MLDINKAAMDCVDRLFRPGFLYKRAGVIAMSVESGNGLQTNFLDFDADRFQKLRKLDQVVDRINKVNGSETIVLGTQQYCGKGRTMKWDEVIKRDHKSPNYTTRWTDIITLRQPLKIHFF